MKRKTIFKLQDECFLLLLESSLKSIPFNIFLCAIIGGYLLYRHAPIIPVFTWCFLLIGLSVIRWVNSKKGIKNRDYLSIKKDSARRRFLWLTFLTGCLWGACYVFFYRYFTAAHQNVITLVLGGMASGALASLSVYLPAYYAYLIPMFLPLIIFNFGWAMSIELF